MPTKSAACSLTFMYRVCSIPHPRDQDMYAVQIHMALIQSIHTKV